MEVNGRVSNLIETLLVGLEYHVVATAVDHLVHVETLVGIFLSSSRRSAGYSDVLLQCRSEHFSSVRRRNQEDSTFALATEFHS